MKRRSRVVLYLAVICPALATPARGQDTGESGLVTYETQADFSTVVDRIEPAVTKRGLFLMRVMDHSAAAAQMGRELGPNTVAFFGNPRVGSQVMNCAPTAGIDLPQKLLVRAGDGGKVLVSYNDPAWLKQRHGIEGCDAILTEVRETLDSIVREVAGLEERDQDD